jgi:hemerythrin-like domain-containing protein
MKEHSMTDRIRPTEPLRSEHRDLLPRIEALDAAAFDLAHSSAIDAEHQLRDLVTFLREHLLPHARAEEVVLYPAIEQAMGAPDATATMRADHTEIVARIDRLAHTIDEIPAQWPDESLAQDVARKLVGLAAILALHFHKEEEVLLPVLDQKLSLAQAQDLFDQMREMAHQ